MKKERIDYIVVEANYGGLELISNFIQNRCLDIKLGFKKSWELMLVVDEICSAIVNCQKNEPNYIKVIWENSGNEIIIKIIDDGTPFNPLNYSEEIEYGLGPKIISQMIDEILYKRENGVNIISLKKCKKRNRKNGNNRKISF